MKNRLIIILAVCGLMSCSEWNDDLFRKEIVKLEEDTSLVDGNGQLYNMSFDFWNKEGSYEYCYGADATNGQKEIWASANNSTASLGYPTCIPSRDTVAVSGPGKTAVKLETRLIDKFGLKKLASGCIFTGQMGLPDFASMNASLNWGIPFSRRPKSLEGYAWYQPAVINEAKAPYENMLGKTDEGHIYVILSDWNSQFIVDPAKSKFFDKDNDPAVIGYGSITFDHDTNKYEKFTIDIKYFNNRTPKYVVIVAASSRLGDYFTGGDHSKLFIDEFKFNYD